MLDTRDPDAYALATIGEEANEVSVLVHKAARFGADSPMRRATPDGETARDLIAKECGDVQAAIEFGIQKGSINGAIVTRAYRDKLRLLLDPTATDNLGRPLAPLGRSDVPSIPDQSELAFARYVEFFGIILDIDPVDITDKAPDERQYLKNPIFWHGNGTPFKVAECMGDQERTLLFAAPENYYAWKLIQAMKARHRPVGGAA